MSWSLFIFAAADAVLGGEALHSGGGALHVGGCKTKVSPRRATTCARGEMRGVVRCCGGPLQQCTSVCQGGTRGGADTQTCIMAGYATLAEAEAECALHGRRLCTVLEHDARCCSTGCHYDQNAVWVRAPQCADRLASMAPAAVPHDTGGHDMRRLCRVAQHSSDGLGHQVEGTLSVMGLHGVTHNVELSRCTLAESACRHSRARNDGGLASLKGCGMLVRRHRFVYDGCSPLLQDVRGSDWPPHLPAAVEHLEGGVRREALAWFDGVRQRFCAEHPLGGSLRTPASRVEKVLHLSNTPAAPLTLPLPLTLILAPTLTHTQSRTRTPTPTLRCCICPTCLPRAARTRSTRSTTRG